MSSTKKKKAPKGFTMRAVNPRPVEKKPQSIKQLKARLLR